MLGAVLALVGPGSYSLDALIGFALPAAVIWTGLALAALVVIVVIVTSCQSSSKQATA
ncbi:MAG TPA: hypothetical protein VH164_00975 [Ktedonobacteraceae bacterium]|nr:hypothetical protein [Ktedonobacteraceae bacterium]